MNKFRQTKQSVIMQTMFLFGGATAEEIRDALLDAGYPSTVDDVMPTLASYMKRGWVYEDRGLFVIDAPRQPR